MPERLNARPRRLVLLAMLVLVVSCAVLFPAVKTTSFHGDESGWITSGRYYTRLALSGSLDFDRWDGGSNGTWGSLNMNLGKWLLGVPTFLALPDAGFREFYDFEASEAENRRRGLVPPDDLLTVARCASAAFGVLSCLLLFVIGTVALNEWAGLVAAGLALSHRLFVVSAARAMTDSSYVCFLLLFCLALVLFSSAEGRRVRLLAAAGCGVAAGLACSIKITGLPLAIAAFSLSAFLPLVRGRLRLLEAVQCAGLALSVALGTTYALNPFFWPVVVRPARLTSAAPVASKPAAPAASELPRQKLDFESIRRFPRLFREWKRFMEDQRARGLSLWDGNRTVELHRSLLMRFGALPLEVLWVPLAGILMLVQCWKRHSQTADRWWPVLAFFAANYLLLLLFLVHNWSRYYLPTITAGRLLLGIALVFTLEAVLHRSRRFSPSPDPPTP